VDNDADEVALDREVGEEARRLNVPASRVDWTATTIAERTRMIEAARTTCQPRLAVMPPPHDGGA
jgi:hypothetical protein